MRLLQQLLTLALAGVMLFVTFLDVVAVHCFANGGQHASIAFVGHDSQGSSKTNSSGCDDIHSCGHGEDGHTHRDHQHGAAEECADQPILSDTILVRTTVDIDQLPVVVALLPPIDAYQLKLTIDASCQPQLCPRPPPGRLRSSTDDFLTLRILV